MGTVSTNLLIIEDEPDTLALYQETMEEAGFKVFPSKSGVLAITLLETERIQLILTDIRMPDVDMNHLLGYLSLHYPQIPIVIATAYPEYAVLTKKRGTTVKAFFNKPVDLPKLTETLLRLAPKQTA